MINRLKPYLPLLLIALVAIAFRFPLLDSLPPGLNFDEGGEGIAALDVSNGVFRIWWPIGGGKEPLMAYLVQPLFWIFGPTRLALRLYTALMGLGAVLATYFLASQLSAFSDQRSAVIHHSPFTIYHLPFTLPFLAALGLATAFWHVAYSRIAFRALSNPMVEALALGFLWMALRSGKWRHFLLASFFIGGLIYTYLVGRFVPIAIALFFIVEALIAWRAKQKPLLVQYWRKLAGMVGMAALVFAPVGVFFALNPEKFVDRAGSVSIFSPAMNQGDFWGTLWRTTAATLGTFLSLTGDPNPLGNIPGKPELNPLLAIFFVLGVGAAIYYVLRFTFHAARTSKKLSSKRVRDLRLGRNKPAGSRNRLERTRNVSCRMKTPRAWEATHYAPYLFLLIWWPIMLLPAILAPEGAPHHLRLIGTAPGTYIFVGLGMVQVCRCAGEQVSRCAGVQVGGEEKKAHLLTRPPAHLLAVGWLLLFIVFGLTAFQTYHDYFIRWNHDIDHYMDFDVYAEELAAQIAAETDPRLAYVIPMDLRAAHEARHYSLDFLYQQKLARRSIASANAQKSTAVPKKEGQTLGGQRSAVITPYSYVPVDEATAAELLTAAAAGKTALRIVRWTQDKHKEADAKEIVAFLLGTGGAAFAGRETYPAYTVERYELPSANTKFTLPAIQTPISATLDGLIQVRWAEVQPDLTASRQVAAAVTYAPIAPMDVDYKVSLRLVGPDGAILAQKDRVLLHNWLQVTSLWPREEVNEYYLLPVPADALSGTYQVRLVVYHPETLDPLTDNGQVEIVLGSVNVRGRD